MNEEQDTVLRAMLIGSFLQAMYPRATVFVLLAIGIGFVLINIIKEIQTHRQTPSP